MGYHVIIQKEDKRLEHLYVHTCDDLAYVPGLTKDSFIYEGDEHAKPTFAGESNKFKNYTEDWYKAGIKAQDIFQKQAEEHGLMIQPITQDQASFDTLRKAAKSGWIKRGDFLIRNAGNVEVDVKCRTFHGTIGYRYFNFKTDEFSKLLKMNSHTKTPVIIAVYERQADSVKEDQLFMFDICEIQKGLSKLRIQQRDDIGSCYNIPLVLTKKGFKLIDLYRY